jgi:uncharacterized protein
VALRGDASGGALSARVLTGEGDLADLVRSVRVVAVIGMKDERHADQPAFGIPQIVQARGIRVIPVNPMISSSLGEKAWPRLGDVPDAFDLVNIFRRATNIPAHAGEILALPPERRPAAVWMQTGIVHEASAARLVEAGIDVVMDRCLGVLAARYRR